MRASAAAERAGVRTVSVVSSGFLRQAGAIARAMGVENMAIAEYPGVPMLDSAAELRRKVEEVVADNIIRGLTTPLIWIAALNDAREWTGATAPQSILRQWIRRNPSYLPKRMPQSGSS